MEKQQILDKTADILRPFETGNLMTSIQELTLEQIFTNWIVLLAVAVVFLYGLYKRSKPVLLTLFSVVALVFMIKLAMPAAGQEMGLKTVIPFVGFGLGIGGVIVYFTFVKE